MKKLLIALLACSVLAGCVVAPAPGPVAYYPGPVYVGGGGYYHYHYWH